MHIVDLYISVCLPLSLPLPWCRWLSLHLRLDLFLRLCEREREKERDCKRRQNLKLQTPLRHPFVKNDFKLRFFVSHTFFWIFVQRVRLTISFFWHTQTQTEYRREAVIPTTRPYFQHATSAAVNKPLDKNKPKERTKLRAHRRQSRQSHRHVEVSQSLLLSCPHPTPPEHPLPPNYSAAGVAQPPVVAGVLISIIQLWSISGPRSRLGHKPMHRAVVPSVLPRWPASQQMAGSGRQSPRPRSSQPRHQRPSRRVWMGWRWRTRWPVVVLVAVRLLSSEVCRGLKKWVWLLSEKRGVREYILTTTTTSSTTTIHDHQNNTKYLLLVGIFSSHIFLDYPLMMVMPLASGFWDLRLSVL